MSLLSPQASTETLRNLDEVSSTSPSSAGPYRSGSPVPASVKGQVDILAARFVDEVPLPPAAHLSDRSSKEFNTRLTVPVDRHDALVPPADSQSLDHKAYIASFEPQNSASRSFTWRIASGYFAYFMCGWGDGVMATVLPHLMAEFNINFMTGSLFYAASTSGFLIGTFLLETILRLLGQTDRTRDKSSWLPSLRLFTNTQHSDTLRHSTAQSKHIGITLASVLHGLFFLVMGSRGGFPAIFVAHMTAAFARAILTGCLNTYFSIVPKHLGYAYAFWSFGGVVAPLVCQAVMATGIPWWHFYLGTLVASAMNSTFLAVAYRPTTDEFQSERTKFERNPSLSPTSTKHEDESGFSKQGQPPSTLRMTLCRPLQWAISIFAGLYFSSETTTQGFMVTFLLETRSGNPKTTGYVTCGFWAGIMVGRLLWGRLTPMLSPVRRRYTIEFLLLLALSMQFVIWFVPSVAASGTALAIIGLVYGPVFPACLNLASDVLPEELRMVAMALISCFASFGCAVLFFIAGVILNNTGVRTLPYLNVTLTGILACYWVCLPIKTRVANLAADVQTWRKSDSAV